MTKDVLLRLRGKQVHVVGLAGTEGAAVVEFLLACGITTVTAHDLATAEEFPDAFRRAHQWMTPAQQDAALRRLLGAPIVRRFRDRYLEGIERADLIYVSQAWFRYPENAPIRRAQEAGIPLSSMTALFFETVPCPILGVTGTNGKFTVVRLVASMLAESGIRTFESGNDRTHVPILYRLDEVTQDAVLVLELSNRQLIGLPYSPHIAVVTNLSPHHLDDHGTFEAYVEAKRTIVAHQGPQDYAILNADDPVVRAFGDACRSRVLLWSRTRPVDEGACLVDGWITLRLGSREERVAKVPLPVPGDHMVDNALGAALAARIAGARPEAIARVLESFRALPHRLRRVAEVGGVTYYEDSLATNPAAAAAAVRSFDRPLVLLAGGHRRDATPEDFRPLADALRERPVRGVVVFGAAAAALEEAVRSAGVPGDVVRCAQLEDAFEAARALARPGDVVTLSPGCESFDQFRDYRHRAARYVELVEALAREGEGARWS